MSLPSFKSPEDMWDKFQSYLNYCKEEKRFVNIAGFCCHCDIHRDTYYEYKNKEFYSDTIKKIEEKIEAEVFESKLSPPEKIFYLKNKFGYADKQEIQQTNVNVDVEADDDLIDKLTQKYLK